jgi:hypothetical protein
MLYPALNLSFVYRQVFTFELHHALINYTNIRHD